MFVQCANMQLINVWWGEPLAKGNCGSDSKVGLSADAVRVFGLIAAGQPVPDEDAEHVAQLAEWGLVSVEHDHPVALHPAEVARRRLEDELRKAAERVAFLAALPELTDQLCTEYERAQSHPGAGSEFIDDPVAVNARLDDVVGAAEREILAAQPGGPRTKEQLERSLARDTAALERGVRKRTLYRATVRAAAVTGEYARTMAGLGAEFRTLVGPFERVIVVDCRVAFISNHVIEDAPEHSAWQVTDPAMIAYIVAEFDAKWRRADPWHGELQTRAGEEPVDTVSGVCGPRTSRRQREILRDISAGRALAAIAHRLGIGLRTVNDEIRELKGLFGAKSLPELIYKWATSPDRLIDDSATDKEVAA